MKRLVPTNDELRRMWREAGGKFHGPHVETGTMPEEKLLDFLRHLMHDNHAREGECQRDAFHGRCCCTCRHRLTDYSHPCTDGKSVVEARGFICAAPELFDGSSGAHSGWTEHGICECHEKKKDT